MTCIANPAVEALVDFFQLGQLRATPELIKADKQHYLWHIQCTIGAYAVKQLNLNAYRAQGDSAHFQLAERIASEVARQYTWAHTALQRHGQYVFHYANDYFLVFPWIVGRVKPATAASMVQLRLIARCLAQLHQLNLPSAQWSPHVLEFANAKAYQSLGLDIWFQPAKAAWQRLQQHRADFVISHGDLWPANVIWQTDQQLKVIDWESAGYQHTGVELWGLLVNWAGLSDCQWHPHKLIAMLDAYAALRQLPKVDKTIIAAGYLSWLDWMLHCQQANDTQAVNACRETLLFIDAHQEKCLDLIHEYDNNTAT